MFEMSTYRKVAYLFDVYRVGDPVIMQTEV